MSKLRAVAISDTHGEYPDLPDGDLLVHCGDFSEYGTLSEAYKFNEWLGLVKGKFVYKPVIVMGNHELFCKNNDVSIAKEIISNATVLQEEEIVIKGKRIYGLSWMPAFGPWAFMKSELALKELHYSKIPEGLDLLITHSPPRTCLDRDKRGNCCGSIALADRLLEMKVRPRFAVCGHIHPMPNFPKFTEWNGISYFNASQMDDNYEPNNDPLVFTI